MSLFDGAREAYEHLEFEDCWRLVPALLSRIREIGRLRAEIERLERENAELRLRFNAPREATLERGK